MKNAMKKGSASSSIRYINDTQALVTKSFAKKAQVFGTEEFKLWREYLAYYPKAQMFTKDIKRNPNKKTTTKNMTYENMKLYILQQDDKEKAKKEFAEFVKEIQRSKVKANPYRAVLAWFIQKYGYVNDYMDFFAAQKEDEEKEDNLLEAQALKLTQYLKSENLVTKPDDKLVA